MAEYNQEDTLREGLGCTFADIQQVLLGTTDDTLRSIQAVQSTQGETLLLSKAVSMGDSVEIWFKELQESMQMSVNRQIKKALQEAFEVKTERSEWLSRHPFQCCGVASLIQWFNSTEHAFQQLSSGAPLYLKDWYHLHLR